jgi:lysophospholipase L1-like esterase
VGDSLTAYGYPKVLSTMIDLPVIDLGEDGITTVQGVRKLDDVLAAQPKVVVIELGGHDYLKGLPREEINERLAQMIRACQAHGAAVILFEIPCGLVTDPMRGVFRQVAREHGARLIPDTAIRKLVFCSPAFPPCRWGWLPQLSDDGIHPNARGNRALASAVRDAIRELNLPRSVDAQGQPTPTP